MLTAVNVTMPAFVKWMDWLQIRFCIELSEKNQGQMWCCCKNQTKKSDTWLLQTVVLKLTVCDCRGWGEDGAACHWLIPCVLCWSLGSFISPCIRFHLDTFHFHFSFSLPRQLLIQSDRAEWGEGRHHCRWHAFVYLHGEGHLRRCCLQSEGSLKLFFFFFF